MKQNLEQKTYITTRHNPDNIYLGITEEDLDNADEIGYVGDFLGMKVYLARNIKAYDK